MQWTAQMGPNSNWRDALCSVHARTHAWGRAEPDGTRPGPRSSSRATEVAILRIHLVTRWTDGQLHRLGSHANRDMHVGLACAARAQRARSRRPRPCACPFTSAIAIATISGRPGWMDAWSMEEGVRTGMVALARRSTCHIHAPRACTT